MGAVGGRKAAMYVSTITPAGHVSLSLFSPPAGSGLLRNSQTYTSSLKNKIKSRGTKEWRLRSGQLIWRDP